MKKMVCFGDSNTFGYDAASRLGERLGKNERWPEVFGAMTGWETVNEGMNGREIPEGWFLSRFSQILKEHEPLDRLAVMLGTNDILNSFCPDAEETGRKMEAFIEYALKQPQIGSEGGRILLIAPPQTDIERYGEDGAACDRAVRELGGVYRRIAGRFGLLFADASGWEIPLAHDGVHFTGEGQRIFAKRLAEEAEALEKQER